MGLWAATLLTVLAAVPNPVAAAVPLVLLTATFEALRGLSAGVERIGRYLQVFYEEPAHILSTSAAAWERTAIELGPRVPGAAGHPLFLSTFLLATLVNLLAVLLPGPVAIELAIMGLAHMAFVVWVVVADRGMRRQRGHELEAFRALRDRNRP